MSQLILKEIDEEFTEDELDEIIAEVLLSHVKIVHLKVFNQNYCRSTQINQIQ